MKTLSLASLLLLPALLCAQPKFRTTELFKFEGNPYIEYLVKAPQSSNLLLVYRTVAQNERLSLRHGLSARIAYKSGWAVNVLSSDLKLISTGKAIRLKFPDSDDTEISTLAMLNGEPTLLFYQFQKKEKKFDIYRASIDKAGTIQPLHAIGSYYAKKDEGDSGHFCAYSPDSTKVLLAFYPPSDERKEPISYLIFDRDWKQIRKGTLQMPNMDAEIVTGRLLLGADASIWTPAWLKPDAKGETVRQEIWHWKDGSSEPERIDVALPGEVLITDMTLGHALAGSDEAVYVGGVYAALTKKAIRQIFDPGELDLNPEQGSFYAKLDAQTGKVLVKLSRQFTDATLRFFNIDPTKIKDSQGVDFLRAKDVYPQPDGSVWTDAEVFYRFKPAQMSGTHLQGGGEPHSACAVLTHYTDRGLVDCEVILPKNGTGTLGYGLSHFVAFQGQSLISLFNTQVEALEETPERYSQLRYASTPDIDNRYTINKKIAAAMLYSDPAGKVSLEKVFAYEDTKYWLEPSTALQLSPGKYVIACQGRKGDYTFVLIDWPR